MSLKHRLVGAAVVIAGLVIFIPMLVDGDKTEGVTSMELQLPSTPKYGFDSEPLPNPEEEFSFRPAEREAAVLAPPVPEEAFDTEPVPAPVAKAVPEPVTVAPQPQKIVPPQRSPVPASPPIAPRPPPPPVASVTPTPTPAKLAASLPGGKGWVVQVGSFSQSVNATALRDRLRADGYTAFIDPAAGGRAVRVKVGPEPDRVRADALRSRLLAQKNLKGFVVSHP